MIPNDSKSLNCDVCIIGGNISGSFLAYLLSQHKINIIVVEEHKSTGSPLQCAGIISQKINNLIDMNDFIILNRIINAKLTDSNGNSISISPTENPYVIDRVKLDQRFSEKAKKNGVKYLYSEKFHSYSIKKSKNQLNSNVVMIKTSNRVIFSKIIVGCDGPKSKVAKLNGVSNKILYGMQIRCKYDIPANTIQMIFNKDWKNLFGWIIPESNGICRIGIGVKSDPKRIFHMFIKKLEINKSQIIDQQGGFIPHGYCKKIVFERCILLGDAACMVKATTGGGIIMLLSAAKIAQKTIISAIKEKKFSKKFLKKEYSDSSNMKKIKKELKIHYIARLFLNKFKNLDFERIFLIIGNQKVKNIIDNYGDMDFPMKFMVKLLFNPKILWFFVLILIKNPFLIFQILWVMINR